MRPLVRLVRTKFREIGDVFLLLKGETKKFRNIKVIFGNLIHKTNNLIRISILLFYDLPILTKSFFIKAQETLLKVGNKLIDLGNLIGEIYMSIRNIPIDLLEKLKKSHAVSTFFIKREE